jgi:hypothetical protein
MPQKQKTTDMENNFTTPERPTKPGSTNAPERPIKSAHITLQSVVKTLQF